MIYAKQNILNVRMKCTYFILSSILALCLANQSLAQAITLAGPAPAPAPGRIEAPIDLTGTWVPIITEDWAYRMLTPAIGDTISVPVNEAAKEITLNWDLEADNEAGLQCKAFGAARIMRVPTRLKISWEDDYTLRIDSDAGMQTRLLHFSNEGQRSLLSMMLDGANIERSWQGYSVAEWENILIDRQTNVVDIERTRLPGGSLKVITTQLKAGYLRPNGVPYSEETVLTEYFNRFTNADGNEWFVVTTIVDDPKYLMTPYVTSSHFRREPDNSKWNPTPCETWAPPEGAVPPEL